MRLQPAYYNDEYQEYIVLIWKSLKNLLIYAETEPSMPPCRVARTQDLEEVAKLQHFHFEECAYISMSSRKVDHKREKYEAT